MSMHGERDGYDMNAPADVFIVSRAGRMGQPRVLWRMSTADAMAVCSDPSTAGANWMLCWTARELIDVKANDTTKAHWFAADDGRFDELFQRLGVRVLMSRQLILDGRATARQSESGISVAKPAEATQLGMFAGPPGETDTERRTTR